MAPAPDNPLVSRLGAGSTGAASLLAATPGWLYVGFDGPDGVELFRAARAPHAAADFEGRGGCSAASRGCEGLGGRGFGRGATRLFAATVLSPAGGTSLWITAGDGVGPVRLFRIDDPPAR